MSQVVFLASAQRGVTAAEHIHGVLSFGGCQDVLVGNDWKLEIFVSNLE